MAGDRSFRPVCQLSRAQVSYGLSADFPGKEVNRDYQVTSFKEVTRGVFFPERAESRILVDDRVVQTATATISEIYVNQALPADALRLTYPQGVTVFDRVEGTTYKAGTDGKPISPPVPDVPGYFGPSKANERRVRPRTETRELPGSASSWILPSALAILAIAGLLGHLRRRRRTGD